MSILEWIRQIVVGIVSGVLAWLPASFGGHFQLIFDLFSQTSETSSGFSSLAFGAAELGCALALLLLFSYKLNPLAVGKTSERRRESKSLLDKIVFPVIWFIAADLLVLWVFPQTLGAVAESRYAIAASLIITGGLLLFSEKHYEKNPPKTMKSSEFPFKKAFLYGMFLMICVVSGANPVDVMLPMLLLFGISRYAAAELSYYFLIPVGIADAAIRVIRFFAIDGLTVSAQEIFALVITCGFALLISFFTVRKLLHFTKRYSMKAFSVYKILLGLLILILAVVRMESQ